ncbi:MULTISPECIES: hypothetical protein [unclassified Neorhizobium]|uniref:hypothetical protein n=1 Tax=unclassified Neorhizobium TaxID=2629175 RepID=UPI001FF5AD0A|nr:MULTISPECIES: hypothetical protein [unclassified Neorhizobium]MCJ9671592.1 hypothetical protein [Neorhizobium sp. SHOUNA12B]MCJ9747721.1 hypothetical protein [Neorhizobium sp. SHOUNA12A]
MDVEPTTATTAKGASGPPDWEYGRKAVLAVWKACRERDLFPSFFLHPEAILAQAELFRDLEKQGATLGLHLHPQKWSAYRHGGKKYFKDFGLLNAQETREILKETIPIFEKAFGHHPFYFRPGTFSFNDAQFAILAELGFIGGSVSAPERVVPHKSAVWAGAELDPHYANDVFRVTRGDSKFIELPLSVDTSTLFTTGQVKHYADLRADTVWSGYSLTYTDIANNIVAQMQERNPAIKTLVSVLHNDEAYFDAEDPFAQNMIQSFDAQIQACKDAGLKYAGVTAATVIEMAKTTLVRAMPQVSLQASMYER